MAPTMVWQQVVLASPRLLTVLVFLGCVTIGLAGVAMLIGGIRGTGLRLRQLRRVRWPSESQPGYEDPRW